MIIILEGTNGVGKTTYAEMTQNIPRMSHTRMPVFRAWRNVTDASKLFDGKTPMTEIQERLGVPVNTHIDDLYAANFLATLKCDAILDRSLPSAIAYQTTPGVLPKDYIYMLEGWQTMLRTASDNVVYVWLTAPHKVAKERGESRWCPNKKEYTRLEKSFEQSFQRITLPKVRIDTAEVTVEDGVRRIWRALRT